MQADIDKGREMCYGMFIIGRYEQNEININRLIDLGDMDLKIFFKA